MPDDARPSVLLLSSNLRRRYAEDVLTALALPAGAVLQFRYDVEYVAPSLRTAIADGSAVGKRVLIGFVADVDAAGPLLIPVRLAGIVSAETVADMVVFRLRVGDYANPEDLPLTVGELRAQSRASLDRLKERNGGRYYPAVDKFPDLRINESADGPQKWFGIARRLALHGTFADSYFVRMEIPLLSKGKRLPFDADGRLALSDDQTVKLRVHFYSATYSDDTAWTLSCATDGTFLRISSDDTYDMASRYDSVEFWLQPAAVPFDALARVTVRLTGSAGPGAGGSRVLATNAHFPAVVRRSRSRLLVRVVSSALGAFLVALPAILGTDAMLQIRILTAVAGAALIAYATTVTSGGGR